MQTIDSTSSLLLKVEQALDQIRPFLQQDGGNVEVVAIQDGILSIRLVGSCESCSMSSMTMKAGIEKTVIKAVPEIKAIQAVS